MTNCKPNWALFSKNFVKELIKANPKIDISDICYDNDGKFFYVLQNDYKRPLGCQSCIDGKISQSDFGDIMIGEIVLLNCKNYAIDNNLVIGNEFADEVANNVWICPNCKRYIFDFLPKFDTMSIEGF